MQFEKKTNGKTIYPAQFKDRVLAELAAGGVSPAELARRYQMPIQNIHRWTRKAKIADESTYSGATPEEMVSKTEARQMAESYEKQIKQLKKALANMTLDRDILKEAVDIASKKKWI